MSHAILSDSFSPLVYNNLQPVEQADREVRTNSSLDAFLVCASRLFRSHGYQDRFGISLLHKHFDCANDERFVEFPESVNGRDALVTRPRPHGLRANGYVPVVWKLVDGRFRPLEYSSDGLAGALFTGDEVSQTFLDDVQKLIEKSPIGEFIGLSIVNRGFYENAPSDTFPIEHSYIEKRASVVFLDPRSLLDESTIETAWTFATIVDGQSACAQTCRKGCKSVDGGHDPIHVFHHIPQAD
jgi:hypothetical protein